MDNYVQAHGAFGTELNQIGPKYQRISSFHLLIGFILNSLNEEIPFAWPLFSCRSKIRDDS